MTKKLPYKVGKSWLGSKTWSLYWGYCLVCGTYFKGFDWARNARWVVKDHIQSEHPERVTWPLVPSFDPPVRAAFAED